MADIKDESKSDEIIVISDEESMQEEHEVTSKLIELQDMMADFDERLEEVAKQQSNDWLANHGQKLFELQCSKWASKSGAKNVAKAPQSKSCQSFDITNDHQEKILPHKFAESNPSRKRARLG